jgi:hypothetical protein
MLMLIRFCIIVYPILTIGTIFYFYNKNKKLLIKLEEANLKINELSLLNDKIIMKCNELSHKISTPNEIYDLLMLNTSVSSVFILIVIVGLGLMLRQNDNINYNLINVHKNLEEVVKNQHQTQLDLIFQNSNHIIESQKTSLIHLSSKIIELINSYYT